MENKTFVFLEKAQAGSGKEMCLNLVTSGYQAAAKIYLERNKQAKRNFYKYTTVKLFKEFFDAETEVS